MNRAEASKALFCIFNRVKRRDSFSSRPLAFSVLPLRFRLLNMRTISKHHFAQIEGSLCADHLSPESLFHQFGDETAVVDVA